MIALPLFRTASAGGWTDCSKLQKWREFGEYKKGDVVWATSDDPNGGEYRCKKDKCPQRSSPSAGLNSGVWEYVGTCKEKPKS